MADIKFSEFPKANQSKDTDELAILQDGVNKMIASPVLESKIINKTVSRVIEQGGASLNIVNLKGVVPTYADLATITPTPELNDAYQVEADGLAYVYTDTGFQADGEGIVVQPNPTGVVEEGNTEAVSGGGVYDYLKPINQDINFLLSDYNKYSDFNGIDGEVVLSDTYTLNDDGDFIEWVSKPTYGWIPSSLYGLFGTRGVSQKNVLGYYSSVGSITEIGLRENVPSGTAPWIRFGSLGELKNDFHKFKLIVNGSNWDLYVDDVLKGSEPKTNNLIIDNIGFAYATNFATFGIKDLKIHTSVNYLETNSVSSLQGATSGVTVKYEKTSGDDNLMPFYVSFWTTGVDVALNPLFGKYIVYCKRKNRTNSYTGIELWHEVDMSEEVWKDYWRIGFAEEYTLNNDGVMVRTHQKVLASGESECVWKRQNTPNQKADFTGGFHGDEIMRANGFKMLIDGLIDDMSSDYTLKPANSVEYSIMSDMTEVADLIDGNIVPIAGHPIDCSHYKRTTFKEGGYDTYNKMVWARSVPVMLWYYGICCYGKVQGTQGFNDSQVFDTFTLQDNSYKLVKTDGERIDYQNPSTGLSGFVTSKMIRPVDKENLSTMRVQDRFYDSKYYNMYQENVTVDADDIWESKMEVVFS